MAQHLLSKAEFARLLGVSKPAVSKKLRGPLGAALVGSSIDAAHPAAAEELSKRGKKLPAARAPTKAPKARRRTAGPMTRPAARASRAAPAPTEEGRELPRPQLSEKLDPVTQLDAAEDERYADLTIREIADRWGTFHGFAAFLDAKKTIAETKKLELANAEKRGEVISRDMVRQHVFGNIEAVNKRLLGDAPRTIARRLYAMAKSGAPSEEAERTVRELISSQLKPVKATAARVLREPKPVDP